MSDVPAVEVDGQEDCTPRLMSWDPAAAGCSDEPGDEPGVADLGLAKRP